MRSGVSPKRGVGPLLGGGRRLRAGGRAPRAAAFSPSPTNVPHLRGTCPPAAARPTDGQGQARCAPSAPAFEQRSRAPAMPHQGARCAVSRRAGYRRTWCSESRRREPRDYVGGRQVATKPAPPALTTALCPRGKLSEPSRVQLPACLGGGGTRRPESGPPRRRTVTAVGGCDRADGCELADTDVAVRRRRRDRRSCAVKKSAARRPLGRWTPQSRAERGAPFATRRNEHGRRNVRPAGRGGAADAGRGVPEEGCGTAAGGRAPLACWRTCAPRGCVFAVADECPPPQGYLPSCRRPPDGWSGPGALRA